jgi:hypothetical protein
MAIDDRTFGRLSDLFFAADGGEVGRLSRAQFIAAAAAQAAVPAGSTEHHDASAAAERAYVQALQRRDAISMDFGSFREAMEDLICSGYVDADGYMN